ncbi:hypothetical protein NMY22_g17761 [Coprinellus aureogranulatus]|nr:hypothetical protein NMY22_g17761 [Coprinellus aureogranulatus]
MLPHLANKIYQEILEHFVDDCSLEDDFDTKATPFGECLPPYPARRRELATVCTLVSKTFYDIAITVTWRYLAVRSEKDLGLLLDTVREGTVRPTRLPIGEYARRVDFRGWRRISIKEAMKLLNRLPLVTVLALECRSHPAPLWRQPSNKAFIRSIPTMCPQLRRLQFLDPREAPSLEEIARLSRDCGELRALQVVHVTEPYSPYVYTPVYIESDSEDSEEGQISSGDEGGGSDIEWVEADVVEPRQYGDVEGSDEEEEGEASERKGEGEEGGDMEERTSTNSDESLSEISDDGSSSSATSTAMEPEGNATNPTALAFGFAKLKYLALGMGNVHGLISERRGVRRLVEAISPYRAAMTKLLRMDINVPLDDITGPLTNFSEEVESSVLHMFYKTFPRSYVLFPNIRRLVLVIHTTYISIPTGMSRLREVDILLRRPGLHEQVQMGHRIARRMVRTAQAVLELFLRDQYPSLESVVLWRGASIHRSGIDRLASGYRRRFLAKGICLQVKDKVPVYDRSPGNSLASNMTYEMPPKATSTTSGPFRLQPKSPATPFPETRTLKAPCLLLLFSPSHSARKLSALWAERWPAVQPSLFTMTLSPIQPGLAAPFKALKAFKCSRSFSLSAAVQLAVESESDGDCGFEAFEPQHGAEQPTEGTQASKPAASVEKRKGDAGEDACEGCTAVPSTKRPKLEPSTGASRRKAYNKRHKSSQKKAKKQKRFNENAPSPLPPKVAQSISSATPIPAVLELEALPANSSGYEASYAESKGERVPGLEELLADGYELVEWDGSAPLLLIDSETGKIFFIGIPKPKGDASYGASCDEVVELFTKLLAAGSFSEEEHSNSRGEGFVAVNFGIGAGHGPRQPYNLRQSADQHPEAVEALLRSRALERLAAHQSASLKAYVPKVYDHYHSHTVPVRERLRSLKPNWTKSIFSAAACNIGHRVATRFHCDCRNLAFGFCAVHAVGKFDHTRGGHIVLKEPKLAIEFPAGCHILLPSATITHGNTPVQEGEVRASFTQYTAGAMFRYVDNGFGTEAQLKRKDKAKYREMLEKKPARWEKGLAMWSTVDDLIEAAT